MVNKGGTLKIAVLGASGGVGRLVVHRALGLGHEVICQTRNAKKLDQMAARVQVHVFYPGARSKLDGFVKDADVVVFALGVDTSGPTTLFSDVTAQLIAAMSRE